MDQKYTERMNFNIKKKWAAGIVFIFFGSVMLIAFQNFSTLDAHWSSDCSDGSTIFACTQKRYVERLGKLEAVLPPLDQSIVQANTKQNVTQLNNGSNESPSQGSNFFNIGGGSFLMGNTLYSMFAIDEADPNPGTIYSGKTFTMYPISQGTLPADWEYYDSITGEFVQKKSNRKIVRIVDRYATTRDNKLYSFDYDPNTYAYTKANLIATNINPYTLYLVRSRPGYFVSGLDNRVYNVIDNTLQYRFTAPSALENPTVEDIPPYIFSDGTSHPDLEAPLKDLLRVCSINVNKDYLCTGYFGFQEQWNVISVNGNDKRVYTPAVNIKNDISQAYLIAKNICSAGQYALPYLRGLQGLSYLAFDCTGKILEVGYYSWASSNTIEYKYYQSSASVASAIAYGGPQKFIFRSPDASTPAHQVIKETTTTDISPVISYLLDDE